MSESSKKKSKSSEGSPKKEHKSEKRNKEAKEIETIVMVPRDGGVAIQTKCRGTILNISKCFKILRLRVTVLFFSLE